jgi:hypothetical protein
VREITVLVGSLEPTNSWTAQSTKNTTLHYSDANIPFDEFLLEQHPTQIESLLFYRATPAEINIPVDAASYMECPDFATLYRIIADELR